ncbi:ABC transporter substrate-binding protein [Runella sp.]|uniref:ABC transporter substrate-binding protein n=1 Tax=Runella sp. TaxID=1960881 RepID=UPI003D0D743C
MRKSLLLICLFPFMLHAQGVDATYEREYKRGVALYKSGDFASAISALTPLTARKYTHGLAPFAHYYWSLATLKTNRLAESRQMLMQLRERFPDWKKMDDVRYVLADIAFQEKQFGEALDYLEEISNASVKKETESLKRFYVNKLQDIAYLKSLNRQHPSDKTVALALIDMIQRTSNEKSDLELSDQLTNRFGAVASKPSTAVSPVRQGGNNLQKGYYNVAVALPFRLQEFNPNQRARSNQFAFDMYEGMKLAKMKLQQEGILVNLFTYDVGNDPEDMLNVVNNANFVQTDLLIGPVYNEPAKLAADYAETNNVFFIHPTSLATDILVNHPNTLLLQPSFERQAQQGFDFMRSQPSPIRKVAIYYGSTRRDSTLAAAYRIKATDAGYQTIDFRKTREKLDSAATITELNKPGHVAVFSSTETDGTKVMNMLTKRRLTVPLLASSLAFNMQNIVPAALAGREVYIIDTEFIDTSKQSVRDFQMNYLTKRNTIPSVYSMQGYDAVLFFGRLLHKYRNQVRSGLDTRTYNDDYLLSGFNYKSSNDNQMVPIVKMDDMRWILANGQ